MVVRESAAMGQELSDNTRIVHLPKAHTDISTIGSCLLHIRGLPKLNPGDLIQTGLGCVYLRRGHAVIYY